MTRKVPVLAPTALPFWFKPFSIFGLFELTMFIERLHMLTILSTLASLRLMLTETPSLTDKVSVFRL
jgi:hypothetical protein